MSDRYDLTIKTGTRPGAGTDANISVTLVGTEGTSGPHKLDIWFKDDFEAGSKNTYKVTSPPLGELIALRFRSQGGAVDFGGHWLLDWAEAERDGKTWLFPNYTWLKKDHELTVLEAAALLPQDAKQAGAYDVRRGQIQARRERFPWRPSDGTLPGSLDISPQRPIPIDESYRGLKEGSYTVVFAETMAKMKLSSSIIKRVWNALDDIHELFASFTEPLVAGRWRDDLEFARQAVQGVSPVHIQSIDRAPEGMPVDDDLVYGNLEPGLDLAAAFADKRIFLLDFEELVGIPMYHTDVNGVVEDRFAPPSRCLLFRQKDGQLRPLAIQLGRDADNDPVFTPKDDPYDWLLAKMYLRCSEGNVHQMLSHAIYTHFTMEPFVMATLRNLSASHPVFKILKRHFRYTLAINEGARDSLLAEGGVFDLFMATGGPDKGHLQLAAKGYATWTIEHNMLPKELAKRGVDDPEVLPYYPYRDDALPIWYAIDEMVHDLLHIFYESDQALIDDEEMQDWWTELKDKGFHERGLPWDKLDNLDLLKDLLTTVIFTVSVQHTAVNYGQYEHYAFVPNAPLCMRKAPPTSKGTITEQNIVDSMPDKTQSSWQVAIGRALASFGKDEEYLLDPDGWNDVYFEEPAARAVVRRFQERMAQQQEAVEAANEERPVAYTLLEPKNIPTSITI